MPLLHLVLKDDANLVYEGLKNCHHVVEDEQKTSLVAWE